MKTRTIMLMALFFAASVSAGEIGVGISNGMGYIGPDFTLSYVPGGLLSLGIGEKGDITAAVKYYEYYRTAEFDGAGVVWERFLVGDFGFAYDFASFRGYEAGAELGFSTFDMSIRYVGVAPGTPYTDTFDAKETGPGAHGGFRITRNLSDHIAARFSLTAALMRNSGTYTAAHEGGYEYEYVKNNPDVLLSLNMTLIARFGNLSLVSGE